MTWSTPAPSPDRTSLVEIASSVIKSKVNIPWHDAERIAKDIYPVVYAVAKRDVQAETAKAVKP